MSPVVAFDFHARPDHLRDALETVRVLSAELLSSSTFYVDALGAERHRYRVVVPEGSVEVETFVVAIEQALGQRVSITSVIVTET